MWNRTGSITRIAIKLGMALMGWTLAVAAHAQGCSYTSDNPYGQSTFLARPPLNVTALTIGRDVPNGTVLYRQAISAQAPFRVTCSAATTSYQMKRYVSLVRQPLSSWNSSPYAGQVYETGVPGIGAVFTYSGQAFPVVQMVAYSGSGTFTVPPLFGEINLIKIGPIAPGVISSTSLPVVAFEVNGVPDTPNTGSALMTIPSFTGSIQIVAQTCTTPDVPVPLGSYKSSEFKGDRTGTPFKDFSIQLTNCPAFYGASASLINTDSATGWVESGRTLNPNVLQYSLNPTTINPVGYPGTVLVASGPGTATRVGVQIVRGDGSDTAVAFRTLMSSGITPTAVSGASYSIPLRARYIQIGSVAPTPGVANTSVEFTINYQ